MKLLLKRDSTSTGFPSPDQLDVGELVMNSVTGKLYTKIVDGSIIEFIGQKICFDPLPTIDLYYENNLITNDNVDNFCCSGAILVFVVSALKVDPHEYTFELTELTNNSNASDINVQTPQYVDYAMTIPPNANGGNSSPQTRTVRKATVPINLSIANNQNDISIFKFAVSSKTDNKKLLEKIIILKCLSTNV
jgi:hypothetical protein